MRGPLPPLAALEAFEAAARHESFARAAAELHLSPSAVSHRIRVLEAHLGHRLFQRLTHGVRLSDRGRAYLPIVLGAFDELASATAGIFDERTGGTVTVRAPVSYGSQFLAPRLPRFTEVDGTSVELLSAIWGGDAAEVEIDFEVRFGAVPPAADLISVERLILITGPDETGPFRPVRVLGYDDLWTGLALSPPIVIELDPPLVAVDTWSAALSVVSSGAGCCALVPYLVAADSLAAKAVVSRAVIDLRSGYWVDVHSPDTMHRPEQLAFLTWLRHEHAEASSHPL